MDFYQKNCIFFKSNVYQWIDEGHLGKYALIYKANFINFYDSVKEARQSCKNYKLGDYLIQPVEDPNIIRHASPIHY